MVTLITSPPGVTTVADALTGWTGAVGLDTETTGLDPRTDRVRLIQIARGERVWLIDVFALPNPVADLAPLFAVLTAKEVVGHNVLFDLRMLAPLGFIPGRVFDTLLASRVLYAGEREEGNNARMRHGLEDAVERELNRKLDKGEQRSDWSGPLTPEQLAYARDDAAVLVPLAEALKAKLIAADSMGTANREFRALPGIAWAQPVHVDTSAWLTIAEAAQTERARLVDAMDTAVPNGSCLPGTEYWNWDSPEQVKKAFAQMGVTVASTDDDTLAGIDHPLAGLLREYRAAAKRVGTYGRSWVDKHVWGDNSVMPSWNQLGASSGRMSCSDPNLQQIPRESEYRRCFVAGPGNLLVKADYSQVELRIAAKVANEQVMIAAYRDGRDLHVMTAARILSKPEAEVTRADRQLAKAVNFGLLYGMGWRGLKQYARANYGVTLTDQQAQAYRSTFFKLYPALQKWHDTTAAGLRTLLAQNPDGTHTVQTLGGRRRVLSASKRDRVTGKLYPNKTDALNTPVQGTGADGLKTAIALLWNRRAQCPSAVPIIFCHDEIVLEVLEADGNRAAEWLRRCMVEAVATLIEPVPVEVEVAVGRTWGG
jgi:DNA polymerase-1